MAESVFNVAAAKSYIKRFTNTVVFGKSGVSKSVQDALWTDREVKETNQEKVSNQLTNSLHQFVEVVKLKIV